LYAARRELSSKELSKILNLTPSNTSKVIKSLEGKGLIKRILGKTDRRKMYFLHTAKGNELLTDITNNSIEVHGLLREIV